MSFLWLQLSFSFWVIGHYTDPKFNTWQILEMVRGFVQKKLLDCKACHRNPLNISKIWTAVKFYNFQCYRPPSWQLTTCFVPILSISIIHKVLGIKFKGGYCHVTRSWNLPRSQNHCQNMVNHVRNMVWPWFLTMVYHVLSMIWPCFDHGKPWTLNCR